MMTLLKGEKAMTSHEPEKRVEKRVTYTLQLNGQIFVIENVPARVNEETGSSFLHLQQ